VNKFEIEVKEKGELPALSFPGAYPIFYVDEYNNILCAECATKEPENIDTHEVHWEGQPMNCERCSKEIPSAYGDPEEEEDE
jgi:hypothetical protein